MILVDPIREYNTGPRGWPYWCHMATDNLSDGGLEELHAYAQALGLRREWFQNHPRHPHYDLPPDKRDLALRMGAQAVSSKELVRRCSRKHPSREKVTEMTNYICVTCGVQYSRSDGPPGFCAICEDDRQYVGWGGQKWTSLDEMRATHKNVLDEDEPGLVGITTEPGFAIGQRARLILSPGGNVLWECISLIDEATVEAIRARGGISAIAISHPHFYSSMIEWSKAFDNAPIFIHEDNRSWVMRPHPNIAFWSGEQEQIGEGLMLVRCGGHFPGSTVLHWAGGAEGRGALLTGDTIYVVQDRRYVSFMYSYPNIIPLNASAVRRIVNAVEPFEFDRIYSSWKERVVASGAKEAIRRSAERYLKAIEG